MKVTVRFTLDVPDGTDPQRVLEVVNYELNSAADGGGLVQWGDWDYSPAELVEAFPPLQPGETRYNTDRSQSVHMHVASGRCTCGLAVPFCGVPGHPDYAHGGHPG